MIENKKIITITVLLPFLFTLLNVGYASSISNLSVIRITSDGSIVPSTAPIHRNGNIYTFIDDIHASIVVDKDNILINGAGYTLQGNYNGTRTDSWVIGQGPNQEIDKTQIPWTIGIDLANKDRHNLTVKNLNIKNFYIGMYLWTRNNNITGCSIEDNIIGILLSGDSNSLIKNYIANNEEGIFFGVNHPGNEPLNITLSRNSFIGNDVHFTGCFCQDYDITENIHLWDDGKEGNFWSDYDGVDINGDGIGDRPYIIDNQNRDRYPLMQSIAIPPIPNKKIPIELLFGFIALLIIIIIVMIAIIKIKNKNSIKFTDLRLRTKFWGK